MSRLLVSVYLGAVVPLGPDCAEAQTPPDIGGKYATYLAQLGEPDLRRTTDASHTYRALWLRAFHEPVSVRVVRRGNAYSVITKQGGRRDSTDLPAEWWNTMHRRYAMQAFWTTQPVVSPGAIRLDGAQWILEGRQGSRYHSVDWWSPQDGEGIEGAYRLLFLEILSLGSVCVSPNAVY